MSGGRSSDGSGGDGPSPRYQDYVIRDGRLIGRFDEMYRNATEVPWRQDQTVDAIFSDISVVILRRRHITSLLDVGCGLGYMGWWANAVLLTFDSEHREGALHRPKGLKEGSFVVPVSLWDVQTPTLSLRRYV